VVSHAATERRALAEVVWRARGFVRSLPIGGAIPSTGLSQGFEVALVGSHCPRGAVRAAVQPISCTGAASSGAALAACVPVN
jgi:hypothetical protein